MKKSLLLVFVFQRKQLSKTVPAVAKGLFGGVHAFVDQPGSGVGPGGAAIQAIGMGQQATFGIAAEALFGVVREEGGGFVFLRGSLVYEVIG